MTAPESRFTYFGAMLPATVGRGVCRRQVDRHAWRYATLSIRRQPDGLRATCVYADRKCFRWGLFLRTPKKIAILTRRLFYC